MKAACTTRSLLDGLQIVGNIVPSSTTRETLSKVKIDVLGSEIELCATDLEVGVRYRVLGAESEETGALVLDGQTMADILRTAPDEKLTLTLEDMNLVIEGRDSYFKVHGEDPADFPTIPVFPDEECLDIEKDALLEMIRKTVFAAGQERTRYALNGVLMVLAGDTCHMVATDGRRLALISKKCNNAANYETHIIVPTKALAEIPKIVTDEDDKIRIKVEENQILVGTKRSTLYAQLIEGQFPDYETVVPKEHRMAIELPTSELNSAVARAGLLATQDSRAVKLSFAKDRLTLSSRDPEQGEARVEMPLKYDGDLFEIAFNPDYVGDMLKVVGTEAVEMRVTDGGSAAVLTDKQDFYYVIMPLGLD